MEEKITAEDIEKFKVALQAVIDLSELSPEGRAEWKRQALEAMEGKPEVERLIEVMFNMAEKKARREDGKEEKSR